jgi:hypothetical protein
MASWTKVQIDFYMPMSFEDTFYFNTNDRGEAIRTAMASYTNGEMRYVNLIHASLCDFPEQK